MKNKEGSRFQRYALIKGTARKYGRTDDPSFYDEKVMVADSPLHVDSSKNKAATPYTPIYQLSAEALREVVTEVIEKTVIDGLLNRYYNVFLSAAQVAMLHGVSEPTIAAYIKRGLIPAEPRADEGKIYKVRASEALKLDLKALRRQLTLKKK